MPAPATASPSTMRLQALARQLAYVPQTLHLIWAAAPTWTAAWGLLLVVQGVLPAASVYLTKRLVDSLTAAMGQGVAWQTIQPTLLAAGLMAAVILLAQVTQALLEWVRIGQSEHISDYLTSLVHEKAIAADLAHYESSEYHDRLYQASNELKGRPLALVESGGAFIQTCITLLAVAALLLPYGAWLPLVLFILALPSIYFMLRFSRLYHKWWQQTTANRRWAHYYDSMLTLDHVAAEVRLFNLGRFFQSRYQSVRRQLRAERLHMAKRRGLVSFGAGLFAAITTGSIVGWMVWQAFLGRVTLGDVALLYQALNKGQGLLESLRASVGQINNNLLFLGEFFAFLRLQPTIVDPPAPVATPPRLERGIQFRRVTFRYPGSQEAVFNDFDFLIPAGKIVAIVGVNGAGKTTLVKLLCRLYDPDTGSIELDGTDLRNFRVEALRQMITGMFQFPVRYFASAHQNIALGDWRETLSAEEVELAANRAGAHEFIAKLPQGYDTLLGKYFPGGVELSGGEWQRLALARSFFRQAPIMILDEPTSFMDSWSEIDWFQRFRELAAGRTTILITHRLTIARKADIIHVMESGCIVESGTHEELLAYNGRYAASWHEQTREPVPTAADPQTAHDYADMFTEVGESSPNGAGRP